jgi:hypothetical protein
LAVLTELPKGAVLTVCGAGFNHRTATVRWRDDSFYVFEQDLPSHSWKSYRKGIGKALIKLAAMSANHFAAASKISKMFIWLSPSRRILYGFG